MEAVLDWVVLVMRTVGSPGVGQGHYDLFAAIGWATAGSLGGALALYWLGAAWGPERIWTLADRIR